MARSRLVVGDVFTVPIDLQRSGIGQVVGTYLDDGYYFAIYDVVVTDAADLPDVSSLGVLFLALSLNAKIAVGHWKVVGWQPVPADMPLPAFKVFNGPDAKYYVENFDDTARRPATADEVDLLPNRKVVAPVRLEKALQAKHGIRPWLEAYTDLAPDEVCTTRRLFG
jgi:hypothetical protein